MFNWIKVDDSHEELCFGNFKIRVRQFSHTVIWVITLNNPERNMPLQIGAGPADTFDAAKSAAINYLYEIYAEMQGLPEGSTIHELMETLDSSWI